MGDNSYINIESDFEDACKRVKELKVKPSMREILDLYALYKQAKVGDCNTPRPRYPDFKGISQWDAWKSKEGTSQEECMKQYCSLVGRLEEGE